MAEGEIPEIFTPDKSRTVSRKISRRRVLVIVFFLLILAGGAYFFWSRQNATPEVSREGSKTENTKGKAPSVKIESDASAEPIPLFGDANYESENFKIGEVAIGGEAEFLLVEDTPDPLEIASIRGEAFTEKNKQEVKLVLNWRTNKLAKSEIEYSKGVGQVKKKISEEDYSLSHSMIIPGLDQASTYVYVINASDRFGGKITSEPHAVYTGSRTVSLFDLIAGAVGDVFGWAVAKK